MNNRNNINPEETFTVHRGNSSGSQNSGRSTLFNSAKKIPNNSIQQALHRKLATKQQNDTARFNDTPTTDSDDMEHVRFRDIIRAWAKQSIKDSALEDKIKEVKQKKSRIKSLKNDLKWAMQADLDEPVKPVKPVAKQPKATKISSVSRPAQLNTANPTVTDAKTIDININFGSLPTLPKIANIRQKVLSFKRYVIKNYVKVGASALVVGLAIGAWLFLPSILSTSTSDKTKTAASTSTQQQPEYQTILPSSKSINDLGGWHRVSPPDRDPVFAFIDKIGSVPINVSQQPLPEKFKLNSEEGIAELAKSYAASHKITAGTTTAYIGTSAQGPQSVILSKNNLLILIKSTQKISDDEWVKYLGSLQLTK